jgi:hypothetical protein
MVTNNLNIGIISRGDEKRRMDGRQLPLIYTVPLGYY